MMFSKDFNVNESGGRVTKNPENLAYKHLHEQLLAYLDEKYNKDCLGYGDPDKIIFCLIPYEKANEILETLKLLRNGSGDFTVKSLEISQIINRYQYTFKQFKQGGLEGPLNNLVWLRWRIPPEGYGKDGMVRYLVTASYISPQDLRRFSKNISELEKAQTENPEKFDTLLAEMIAIIWETDRPADKEQIK